MPKQRTLRDAEVKLKLPKYLKEQVVDYCRRREMEVNDFANFLFKQELERVERVEKAQLGRKA